MARCTGKVKVSVDHSQGSWSSYCDVALEVECDAPSSARCYWNAPAELDGLRELTAAQLTYAQVDHDLHAARAVLDA